MTIFSIYSSRPFLHAFSFQILYLICNNKSQIRKTQTFQFSVGKVFVQTKVKVSKANNFHSGNLVGKHDLLTRGEKGRDSSRLGLQKRGFQQESTFQSRIIIIVQGKGFQKRHFQQESTLQRRIIHFREAFYRKVLSKVKLCTSGMLLTGKYFSKKNYALLSFDLA